MKYLSKALGFGIAVVATFAACAAAATLALSSTRLSAGNVGVTACTSSLAATRNVNNAGNVTQVNVAGIPAACSGETLSVTLVNAANAALGSGSATVGNCGTTCSATITGFGTVSALNVVRYSYGLTGA
ncbi:MAG: hypothetical protein ABSB24_07110 [Gaiellaceae bacterium]|jgi:uncharacterized Zn-binding protein involved in type VI secretion